MIHAENLTVHYPTGESPALDGVSFDVAAGDVLGVVGPVDSGKSTLAKAVAGFVPSVTGGILDGDLEVAGRDPRSGVDGTAAMVFEDYSSQLTQVRVRDEVIVPLLDRGLDRETAERRVEALLERVRLDGYATERTWELSGGEQQRVAIAAALATDPEVLVLDTATEMLDPEGRADVSNLISSLAGETTLVVTVEDAQELVGVADDVLVLDDGEAAAFGPAGDVLRDYERFADRGINPPTCVTAAHELGLDGAPLTRDEFVAATEGIETPRRDRDRPQRAATDGAFGEPVACLDGVTFRYGDDVAIDDVDMTLGAGEVHAVVGGNGAGKTTLTRLLVGLESPDEGRVVVDGTDTSDASAAAVAESVGLAFQDADVQLGRATVEDEIRFPLEQRQHERSGLLPFRTEQRYDDAFVDERTETVLSLAGLEDVREADPTKLPQGDRRLTAIASAVAPDPDVVVLDEPTAGLDAAGYERVSRTIDRVREQGTAVLLVEHDMEFVCETADRVTLLNDGAVELAGPPADVFAREHWDALRRRYVRPPRGARLADHLDVDAFTVDELVAELGTREVDA